MVYPLVNQQFANWKMAIEIVDFPINSMVIFHSYVNVYQMVPTKKKRFPKEVPLSHAEIELRPSQLNSKWKNHLPHGELSRPKKNQATQAENEAGMHHSYFCREAKVNLQFVSICWLVCVWLCIVSSPWYPCFHTPELAGIVPHNEATSVGPSPHLAHVGYSQMLSPIFTIFLCNMIPSGKLT